jgi:NAD(P)H-flavin reductase/ferredoxin/2-polyprenyl-6-methoxyphenol hydroxylase-like FAD-dependent oxidoreductase
MTETASNKDGNRRLRVGYSDGAIREVPVAHKQTILDAAEAHGVPIVSSCKSGVCGTCVARCVSGKYSLQDSIGLSQSEKDSGRILTCQTVLESDCEIAFDYPFDDNAARVVSGIARVTSLKWLSSNVALLTLDASALDGPLDYAPGQYAQLRVPETQAWRSYSFLQANSTGSELQFLIRIIPNGVMSAYLTDQCLADSAIEIRGPKGSFRLRSSNRPIVLLAGGTGISAIMSMAEHLANSDNPSQVKLFYGVNDGDDLVLTEQLERLSQLNPRFEWKAIVQKRTDRWAGPCGFVTDLLQPEDFASGEVDVYLCGPPAMVDAGRKWLAETGLTNANLYYEKFLPSGASKFNQAQAQRSFTVDVEALQTSGAGVAIVAGGSIAGIAAAKVLAGHFTKVIVLEKDHIHHKMEGRNGAAQGWHLHHLVIAGQRQIETIFPGVIDEMVQDGAFKVDMGEQYRIFIAGAWKKAARAGVEIVCAGRPLLEWTLRRRLDAEPSIEYRYESEMLDFVIDPGSGSVVGVIVDCNGSMEMLGCEFLVDAGGKNTPVPRLLERHGFDTPKIDADDINCFYSTMQHRVPPERAWRDRVMMICYPYRPQQLYYAAQYFTDNSRTLLSTTLVGYNCYDPPRNVEEFRAFARRMPTQLIGDELDGLEPASPVHNFRYPTMQRFSYQQVRKYPAGLVSLGDALSSADPVSGVGMTKAFLEVSELRELLGSANFRESATILAYYEKVNGIGDAVWDVIREQTMRYPWIRDRDSKRPRFARLQNWYVDRLMEAMHDSDSLYRIFLSVTHLVSPVSALMKPAVVARVASKWLWSRLRFHRTLIEQHFGPQDYPPRSDQDCRPSKNREAKR